MEANDIIKAVKQQPFEAVRIHVSDGHVYDITHADQLVVDRRAIHVGVGGNDGGPFSDIHIVANMHITRITPLKRKPRSPAK